MENRSKASEFVISPNSVSVLNCLSVKNVYFTRSSHYKLRLHHDAFNRKRQVRVSGDPTDV